MEIEKPSLKELLTQRQTLEQQVSAARQREAEVVLADIVRKMHEYQISLADLMGRKRECQKDTSTRAPKYRDLRSGATWSGRGRAPHWIVDKNRDDFLVRA
jgi:DNA-binding protein H-NS